MGDLRPPPAAPTRIVVRRASAAHRRAERTGPAVLALSSGAGCSFPGGPTDPAVTREDAGASVIRSREVGRSWAKDLERVIRARRWRMGADRVTFREGRPAA